MARQRGAQEHGTMRGYGQHNRAGTIPCTPCLVAKADNEKQRRDRGRCAKGLGWPLQDPAVSHG